VEILFDTAQDEEMKKRRGKGLYGQQFWAEGKLMRTKSKMGSDKREKQAGRG